MGVEICLVFGLPAVGKSTFVEHFMGRLSDIHCCLFTYDELMPKQISFDESSSHVWKDHRTKITKMVEQGVRYLQDPVIDKVDLMDSKARLCQCFQNGRRSVDNHIVFIDDNMFYRSMRYTYYQLAREFECSYCQIYLTGSLDILIDRNNDRTGNIVSTDTIVKMNDIFEAPDTTKHNWEKNTKHFDVTAQPIDVMFEEASDFIRLCSIDVLKPVITEEELKEKEISRLKNLESYIHQCDQILRKYISTRMNQAKSDEMSKEELRNLALKINESRKHYLRSFHSTNCVAPTELFDVHSKACIQYEINKFEEFLQKS